jgi:hypothetical protein
VNTRVLGYWQPDADLTDESEENHNRIAEQFKSFVKSLGHEIKIHSVHSPADIVEWIAENKGILEWHQDGTDTIDHENLVMWSNLQPMEVRFFDGTLLKAEDGAVILIDNLEVEHRMPQPIHPDRWLVRSVCNHKV